MGALAELTRHQRALCQALLNAPVGIVHGVEVDLGRAAVGIRQMRFNAEALSPGHGRGPLCNELENPRKMPP